MGYACKLSGSNITKYTVKNFSSVVSNSYQGSICSWNGMSPGKTYIFMVVIPFNFTGGGWNGIQWPDSQFKSQTDIWTSQLRDSSVAAGHYTGIIVQVAVASGTYVCVKTNGYGAIMTIIFELG